MCAAQPHACRDASSDDISFYSEKTGFISGQEQQKYGFSLFHPSLNQNPGAAAAAPSYYSLLRQEKWVPTAFLCDGFLPLRLLNVSGNKKERKKRSSNTCSLKADIYCHPPASTK